LYNLRVKLARILGIAFGVVLCFLILTVVLVAVVLGKAFLPKLEVPSPDDYYKTPQRQFQLGDLSVIRYGPSEKGTYSYSFTRGPIQLSISHFPDEDGQWHTGAMLDENQVWNDSEFEFGPPAPALPASLPGEAGKTLDEVREVASAALVVKEWPSELLQAKPWVSDAARGKFQLTTTMDSIKFDCYVAHYDDEEIVLLDGMCNIWKNRCVTTVPNEPVIELSPGKNTVFAANPVSARECWIAAGAKLRRDVLLLSVFPQMPARITSRVNDAYAWWSSGKYRLAPEMDKEQAASYAAPWEALAKPKSGVERGSLTFESAEPITINSVKISPDNKYEPRYLDMKLDGKSLWWSLEKEDDWQSSKRNTYVRISENEDYPVLKWDCDIPDVKADLDMMKSFARQLIAAEPKDWPDEGWSKYLRKDMQMLNAGKYWTTYPMVEKFEMEARETFKGKSSYLVCYINFTTNQSAGSWIEIKISPEGFVIYDPAASCLLEVGGEVKLTQKPDDIAAGKKLNTNGAKMLVAYAQLIRDDLTPELVTALAKPESFLSRGKPPAPIPGDVPAPSWSNQAKLEQISKMIEEEQKRGWKPYY
jgi:hypothetical protein